MFLLRLVPLVGVAILFAWYWLTAREDVPVTGRSQMVAVSREEAAALGARSFDQFLGRARMIREGPEVASVIDITTRLANAADVWMDEIGYELPDYQWQVALIDNPAPNAFALPGGKIGVHDGILPVTANADGLAIILGHEIGHIIARHGAERMTQQKLADAGRIAIGTATGDLAPGTREAINAALGLGARYGILMPFSRKHEAEADHIGLLLAARACFDPREAPLLWARMRVAGGRSGPDFLSTHPAPDRRAETLAALMDDALEARAAAGCAPLTG